MNINFDEWAELYKKNPDGFESRRKAVIEEFITGCPEQHHRRLRGLQFRIDMERRRAGIPLEACAAINTLMFSHFEELRDALDLAWAELTPGLPE